MSDQDGDFYLGTYKNGKAVMLAGPFKTDAEARAEGKRRGMFDPQDPECWAKLERAVPHGLKLIAREHFEPTPVDVVLFCPECGVQHIDAPEPSAGWDNPPHRSHLCHGCGVIWRPADVPTNGVAAPKTRGERDTWGWDKNEQ